MPWYVPPSAEGISTPALLVYPERIEENVQRMLRMVGNDPLRLWPHVKTSKCRHIIERMVAHGIRRFKGATLPELEIALQAGATDLLLAIQPSAAIAGRLLDLAAANPSARFHAVVDDMQTLHELEALTRKRNQTLTMWVDLDVGMHRTGIAPGPGAAALIETLAKCPTLETGGWHAYDGHLHQSSVEERRGACREWSRAFKQWLASTPLLKDHPLPLIAGGTPTFPMHAEASDRICSPGTSVLWDAGYAEHFPDLAFEWACVLMGRVVSKPTPESLCLDLGHKSVASEMPHPRLHFLNLAVDAFLGHSEEHLVVSSPEASRTPVGTLVYAIPRHVCPTVALHQELLAIQEEGEMVSWPVAARQRRLNF